jgi:hypothetical protein
MRGMGGTIQYGIDNMPNVGEFCCLGMWMNTTMSMRANVELSKDCHKAWCARLAGFLKCVGVLSCEAMDMCNPPDLDMVA